MNAWQAYRSLNAEQRQILKEGVIDTKRSPDDLIKMLAPIASYDQVIGGWRKRFGVVAIVSLIATVVLFFAGGGIFLLAAAALFLASTVVWWWMRGLDVSDNLRDTALPVLKLLKEDFARRRQVHARFDLRLPTHKSKSQGKSAPFAHGNYHHVVDEIFIDPWMSVEGTLNDGAHLAFRVVDSTRLRSRRKRSISGKTKFSSRKSKKTSIEVQLAVRRKAFDVVPGAGAEIKSNEKRHVVSLHQKIQGDSLDPVSPTAIIDLVADAYRNVRPAGVEARV